MPSLWAILLTLTCSSFAVAESGCQLPEPAQGQLTYCAEALSWRGERALMSLEAPRLEYMIEGQRRLSLKSERARLQSDCLMLSGHPQATLDTLKFSAHRALICQEDTQVGAPRLRLELEGAQLRLCPCGGPTLGAEKITLFFARGEGDPSLRLESPWLMFSDRSTRHALSEPGETITFQLPDHPPPTPWFRWSEAGPTFGVKLSEPLALSGIQVEPGMREGRFWLVAEEKEQIRQWNGMSLTLLSGRGAQLEGAWVNEHSDWMLSLAGEALWGEAPRPSLVATDRWRPLTLSLRRPGQLQLFGLQAHQLTRLELHQLQGAGRLATEAQVAQLIEGGSALTLRLPHGIVKLEGEAAQLIDRPALTSWSDQRQVDGDHRALLGAGGARLALSARDERSLGFLLFEEGLGAGVESWASRHQPHLWTGLMIRGRFESPSRSWLRWSLLGRGSLTSVSGAQLPTFSYGGQLTEAPWGALDEGLAGEGALTHHLSLGLASIEGEARGRLGHDAVARLSLSLSLEDEARGTSSRLHLRTWPGRGHAAELWIAVERFTLQLRELTLEEGSRAPLPFGLGPLRSPALPYGLPQSGLGGMVWHTVGPFEVGFDAAGSGQGPRPLERLSEQLSYRGGCRCWSLTLALTQLLGQGWRAGLSFQL